MNKNLIIIIPVKLRSRRLKNKNILPVNGLPMFVYVAQEANKSKNKPTIFISSESSKIRKLCDRFNLNFIKRPKKLSLSTTEKQEAIVHGSSFIKKKFKHKPKIVVSLQCNSPEFNHKDFDHALEIFKKKFSKKKNKELISVGLDNCQNAAFRIMTFDAVFQKTLSTNLIIFHTDYLDIHTEKDLSLIHI